MLRITVDDEQTIHLKGRFDAAQVRKAEGFFLEVDETRTLDLAELAYIASAGLGVLLAVQQRLGATGHRLKLSNLNHSARDIFRYSGLDQIFEIL